jgi:hypothetical protein
MKKWEDDDVGNADMFILWSGPVQFQRELPSPFPTRGGELFRLSMSCPRKDMLNLKQKCNVIYLKFVHC